MEQKALVEGQPRIKFQCIRTGSFRLDRGCTLSTEPNTNRRTRSHGLDVACDHVYEEVTSFLELLQEMEECGAAPVLPDGKIAGNGSLRLDLLHCSSCGSVCGEGKPQLQRQDPLLLVSRSGKEQRAPLSVQADTCIVTQFDDAKWSCSYVGPEHAKPTSDSPLHWCAMVEAAKALQWREEPVCALHGHVLDTEADAERAGAPISWEETLFSTREDRDALRGVMGRHPYPQHALFIRRGHGFFLLGASVGAARKAFRQRVVPLIRSKLHVPTNRASKL